MSTNNVSLGELYKKWVFARSSQLPATEKEIDKNALEILKLRYFIDLPDGQKESNFSQLCRRVARVIAAGEYKDNLSDEELEYILNIENSIYNDMMSHRFLFNSPALFSAGVGISSNKNLSKYLYKTLTPGNYEEIRDTYEKIYKNYSKNQMMFACFTLEVPDSIEGIFDSVKNAAIISKYGGGVGANFGHLREKGALIAGGCGGQASGPISFMQNWNTMGSTVVQGGKRRAALMGMLNIHHPDIEEFISCKEVDGSLSYFNISVAIDDKFMQAVKNDDVYDLKSPTNGRIVKTVKARDLWNKICTNAHKNGDPGLFFIDIVNRDNLLKNDEKYYIETTNPCLTGDTLVAVADGRNAVSFKQLAEENKDVPIYCLDRDGNITIKMMRHPRITGYDKDVYEIKLSDGSTIKATSNHKFKLKDSSYKEVSQLQVGDYLWVGSKKKDIRKKIDIEKSNDEFNRCIYIDLFEELERCQNSTDLKCFINVDAIYVEKHCEVCGRKFSVPFDNREISVCSIDCGQVLENAKGNLIGSDSLFQYYGSMIVDISYIGKETVYNGTVDQYHNICTVLPTSTDLELYFINSLQCGEQPLPNDSSCNLGSINLAEFVTDDGTFNYKEFKDQILRSIYYLDLVIDVTNYPLKKIEKNTKDIRPVGLGIMGLADACIMLGIKYGSKEFEDFTLNIAKTLAEYSLIATAAIAAVKGPYPHFDDEKGERNYLTRIIKDYDITLDHIKYIVENVIPNSDLPTSFKNALINIYNDQDYIINEQFVIELFKSIFSVEKGNNGLRNSRRLSIAPTGTISLLLNTSSGIEPNFSYTWTREVTVSTTEKQQLTYHHRLYNEENEEQGLLIKAHDLTPLQHVKAVSIFAPYIDSAISKTVNMPNESTVDDVKKIYEYCFDNGIKGVTIYRDGSRSEQPIKKVEQNKQNNNNINVSKVKTRPKFMHGVTTKCESPYGSIYITANFDDDGKMFETFISAGKSGSVSKSITEALSRVISLALRSGVDIKDLIDTMSNISGSEIWVYDSLDGTEIIVKSIPDAASKMLRDLNNYYKLLISGNNKDIIQYNQEKVELIPEKFGHYRNWCPECNAQMIQASGCSVCPSCGYSDCK